MSIKTIDVHFMDTPKSIAVYLLESEDGPILFETGPYSCLPYLEKGLAELGYQTSDIKHVFLTHIHLDHAGGAWHFAQQGAKIYVHPKGQKHLVDPSKLVDSATKIYGDQMDYLWGKIEPINQEQLVISEHNQNFNIGNQTIKSLHSPGHAVHHIAWNTSGGIICGDVAGIRIAGGPVMPPCPPPDINLDHWKNSIDILLAEAPTQLFITHFGGYENGVEHLTNLRKEIDIWDAYVSKLFKKNPDPKKASFDFSEWIEDRIMEVSGNPAMIPVYATVNPAWISIHGLYRYYHKKSQDQA